MKKMRINRRGFSLVEMILVVAIIVILSGAAFVGVAVTIDRAKTTGDAAAEHGKNFEEDAWIQVNSIAIGAADFFDIHEHTPIIVDQNDDSDSSEDDTSEEDGTSEDDADDTVLDTSGKNHVVIYNENLKAFLDAYGISYIGDADYGQLAWSDGPNSYGGKTFTQAYNEWRKSNGKTIYTGGQQQDNNNNNNNNNDNNIQPSNEPVTVGNITMPNGYNTDMSNGVGVTKVVDKGNGAYSIDIHTSTNTATITVVPNGNGYTFTISGNQWMLQGMPGYGNNGYNDFAQTRNITEEDWKWIQEKWDFEMK